MIDLSTSGGITVFTDLYSTRRGRWLANKIGLSGKGAETLAGNISSFVWNVRAMEACKTDNERRIYSHACSLALGDILASPLLPSLRHRFRFPPLARYSNLSRHGEAK